MIDGVYFIRVYWLLSVLALASLILVLYSQLHRTSTTYLSLQVKAILFGASMFDFVSLWVVGLTLLSGWHIGVEDEKKEYCASISWPASFINVHLLLIAFMLVWLRQVFLLKDANLPVERFVMEDDHLADNHCLKVIINGPPNWLNVTVLASFFMSVLAFQNDIIGSYPDDFSLCRTVSDVHWPILAIGFVCLTILWPLVTVMTTSILKHQRLRHDCNFLFVISDTADKKKPSSLFDTMPNNSKVQTSSQLPLFLVVSYVWLPPVLCLALIAIFDFDATTEQAVFYLTLVYSCLQSTFSLILSVCVCCRFSSTIGRYQINQLLQ